MQIYPPLDADSVPGSIDIFSIHRFFCVQLIYRLLQFGGANVQTAQLKTSLKLMHLPINSF